MSTLGRLLHPLPKKDQALLLTLLTYGGNEWESLLKFLPEQQSGALIQKSEKLSELPLEKRVPLFIRELRQLVKFRPLVGLEAVDPTWLVAGFQGESPRTIAVTLMHMPSSVSNQIVSRLPREVQEAMPSRRELSQLPMEILKRVRRQFHDKFATMPVGEEKKEFGFVDVLSLQGPELVTLVRHIGVFELAAQISSTGRRALAQFLKQQPTHLTEELMAVLKNLKSEDLTDRENAEGFIKRIFAQRSNTEELCQKAGLYRLARALEGKSRMFSQQLAQRFPRAHGRLLMEFIQHLSDGGAAESELHHRRVRNQVVDTVLELARRGKLNAAWVEKRPEHEALE